MNQEINDNDACRIIVTTLCDQMRRAYDVIMRQCRVPAFLMNVPAACTTAAARQLYLDELERLGRFLVRLGGHAPSNDELGDVMLGYDSKRSELMSLRGKMPSSDMARAIVNFHKEGPLSFEAATGPARQLTPGVPLAIVGGPLLLEHLEIFNIVAECGGQIVLDATETGVRGICRRFDKQSLNKDALTELANAYFDTIPDASNRSNDRLYRWLREQFDINEVQGVIFHSYLWCDIWRAELARMKQWAPVPLLDINISGYAGAVSAAARHRIEAFLEMLK
jgi:benzoyl-CoA reductase/2-hydroxyglutaryl-CoA dehydratase subunit BcrC/BadD/HgdB